MKKIFQKNQLIITALALMIAVAGYFSYMNNHIDDGTAAETAANAGTDVLNAEYEISDEDPLAAEDIFTDEGTGEELALVDGTETADAGTGEDTYDAADAAVTDGSGCCRKCGRWPECGGRCERRKQYGYCSKCGRHDICRC